MMHLTRLASYKNERSNNRLLKILTELTGMINICCDNVCTALLICGFNLI